MKYFLLPGLALALIAGCKSGQDTTASHELTNQTDSLSYAIGQSIGQNLTRQEMDDLDPELIAYGIEQNLAGSGWDELTVQTTIETVMRQRQELALQLRMEEDSIQLAEIAARPEVMETESGLLYEVIQEGTGPMPLATDQVTAHYTGMLMDGEVFQSSKDRGEPITMGVSGFIPGWIEGLQLMKEGATYKFYIPQNLAYGSRPPQGSGIPPNSALIFELELLKVNP